MVLAEWNAASRTSETSGRRPKGPDRHVGNDRRPLASDPCSRPQLPEPMLYERVDDEWSFVETLRHLVMATDCWLRRMVKSMDRPYHPWGIAGSWLTDPAGWGIDPEARPSLQDVLDLRRGRMDEVGQTIAFVTAAELQRVCTPPASPGHPTSEHTVLECLHVIMNEEWEHNCYASRDLDILDNR